MQIYKKFSVFLLAIVLILVGGFSFSVSRANAAPTTSDATLKTSSTVKGIVITSLGVSTASPDMDLPISGSVTISSDQADDLSGTSFEPTQPTASVTRIVKFSGATSRPDMLTNFTNPETPVYIDGVDTITDGDVFIVQVTAEDLSILYHMVTVHVTNPPALNEGFSFSDDDNNSNATIIHLGAADSEFNIYYYKISSDENPLPIPPFGSFIDETWTQVTDGTSIETTNGKYIGVADTTTMNILKFSNGQAVVEEEAATIPAIGTATAVDGSQTITYTLTTGTFDSTEALDLNNWEGGGVDIAELMVGEVYPTILLSEGDTVATFTLSGTVVLNHEYIFTPKTEALTSGYTAPEEPTTITVVENSPISSALSSESTIRGVNITNPGTPSDNPFLIEPGSITLTPTQATTPGETSIIVEDIRAGVDGFNILTSSTLNACYLENPEYSLIECIMVDPESMPSYDDETTTITDGDVFVILIKAEDNSSESFYIIQITVGEESDPVAEGALAIYNGLLLENIYSNLNEVNLSNYTSFPDLYFEKLDQAHNKIGRITFTSPLNFDGEETSAFLLELDNRISLNTSGTISFDFSNAENVSLYGVGATIIFYGLDDFGFTDSDDANAKLVALDDDGIPVDISSLVSSPGTYIGNTEGCIEAGNCYSFTVTVDHFTDYILDITPPVISLVGSSTINLTIGDEYTELGATATDDVDGTITENIIVGGDTVDGDTLGSYEVTYNVSDSAGNPATQVTRTIVVSEESEAIDLTTSIVTGFVAPVRGATPITIGSLFAGVENQTKISLTWSPSHSTFRGAQIYVATVVLTSDEGYKFQEGGLTPTINSGTGGTVGLGVVGGGDVSGNTLTFRVTFPITSLASTQVRPNGSGVATSNSTTPQIVIPVTQALPVTIGVSSGTTNPEINVSAFVSAGVATIPEEIQMISSNANDIRITIPEGITITSTDATWDGIISAPTTTTVTLPIETGYRNTQSKAIQIGQTGETLSFDKAVRILFPNEADKKVGYKGTGNFTEITTTCTLDDQDTVDAQLVDGLNDCKINSGSDLVVWTKHFTSFVTYTQTTNSTSGGGSGGGSYTSSLPIVELPLVAETLCPNGMTLASNCTVAPVVVTETLCPNGMTLVSNCTVAPIKVTTNIDISKISRTLRLGLSGEDVNILQKFLISQSKGPAAHALDLNGSTKYFGPLTRAAIVEWQAVNQLVADGIVGPNTMKKMSGF
ncbi:MAG: immunoglobulin-like domain-containing protein [Candidatus Paceibacterota bacterium]